MADESYGVSGRDSDVLRLIEEEALTSFSFEGLKRRTGTHPETLSRTLDRLKERNILEKADGEYRLTDRGKEWLNVRPLSRNGGGLELVRTLLPPTVPFRRIFTDMKGRWFGPLRWLGYSDTPGEVVLKWMTADGKVQLDARFSEGELTIEGRILQGEDVAGAVRASHQLMAHISRAYTAPKRGRALMFRAAPVSLVPN